MSALIELLPRLFPFCCIAALVGGQEHENLLLLKTRTQRLNCEFRLNILFYNLEFLQNHS